MMEPIIRRRFSYLDIAFMSASVAVYEPFGLWAAVGTCTVLALVSGVIEAFVEKQAVR